MGMSTHLVFLRDRNSEDHQRKVAVLRACNDADIDLPKVVFDYFMGTNDEDIPLEVEVSKDFNWSDDHREGF